MSCEGVLNIVVPAVILPVREIVETGLLPESPTEYEVMKCISKNLVNEDGSLLFNLADLGCGPAFKVRHVSSMLLLQFGAYYILAGTFMQATY